MITLDELKKNAQFRGVLFLDMNGGSYQNQYVSTTYPRLTVIKSGAAHSPKVKQHHETLYFVDGVECGTLDIVVARLNAAPFKRGNDD